ncbi:hypothetical protein C8Q77DRAFT_279499 [Trametes polyzona]|nr:hypothetical protein C8Q77DRAFT_279499 [Trametes polyzona]
MTTSSSGARLPVVSTVIAPGAMRDVLRTPAPGSHRHDRNSHPTLPRWRISPNVADERGCSQLPVVLSESITKVYRRSHRVNLSSARSSLQVRAFKRCPPKWTRRCISRTADVHQDLLPLYRPDATLYLWNHATTDPAREANVPACLPTPNELPLPRMPLTTRRSFVLSPRLRGQAPGRRHTLYASLAMHLAAALPRSGRAAGARASGRGRGCSSTPLAFAGGRACV